jgi:hypothetical protein|tara:strand:- start:152 stop:388 length:237 start_codon:yes stop_codon:yes gene_type:complete
MKYDWEKEIDLESIIDIANLDLPDHLSIIGLAVANTEYAEACLKVTDVWVENRIARLDVMSDVSGDAKSLYEECFKRP